MEKKNFKKHTEPRGLGLIVLQIKEVHRIAEEIGKNFAFPLPAPATEVNSALIDARIAASAVAFTKTKSDI
jgi:hypothetical protein